MFGRGWFAVLFLCSLTSFSLRRCSISHSRIWFFTLPIFPCYHFIFLGNIIYVIHGIGTLFNFAPTFSTVYAPDPGVKSDSAWVVDIVYNSIRIHFRTTPTVSMELHPWTCILFILHPFHCILWYTRKKSSDRTRKVFRKFPTIHSWNWRFHQIFIEFLTKTLSLRHPSWF